MLLLTAITLLTAFAILCWRGPFLGSGFGAASFRFYPAFPGCSLPFRQGPARSDFIGISFRTSTATNKKHKPQGRGSLQSYRLALPAGTVLPAGLPVELEVLAPVAPEESQTAISDEYPQLCRRLLDLGLRLQLAYNQPVAARIAGKSERTLREWSRQGKIACHRCGGIASTPSPYYTARSLENCLSQRERGKA